ncbi:MAG TPA: S-methyl-5'-thioadenosine phosphorylase [Kribbellaceae bacterium]|nr:S-methyl-5'-thioadenosine phosphorylase [Kribbellaceae bacterium]
MAETIGVIGGSGLYELLSDADAVDVGTPYGPPSAAITAGTLDGKPVAFVPRHGTGHELTPHRINYRANLWALRSLGVRQVLAPCAVGSLDPALTPGSLVVPDQVIDRTSGRDRTFYDVVGAAVHVGFADPYCARGRATVRAQGNELGLDLTDGGALVVIDGPRFSTRAESRWHAAAGGRIVGMTGMPEAALARELALCYTTIALVTDHDAGVESGTGVTQAQVLEAFAAGLDDVRRLLSATVGSLGSGDCECRHALDGLKLPIELP